MPQWRQGLTKSLHQTRSMPESRYVQLASVDESGFPHCRTVVFRGLTDNNELVVISDTRSEKYQQLLKRPQAQVCWYFSKTREQYRFTCNATVLTAQQDKALVSEQWNKLSDAGKKQFFWGEPGTPRHDSAALQVEGDFKHAPEHFCVILLAIETVDYLYLRGNPQNREWHEKNSEGNWVCQALIP
ncbi:MAG: pyridoxamine 5'-phosphate oxidase family protein [Pseudomonadota bacterium]|jgi:PPOX class probable FMN-dependent enzyme|nr:pyridoxamine 5'-phosphate oxidase family protein [Pseudomonadota bacterium]MEC8416206.1 pyridoxamine 5'-phosphate oxidase family protein [Pseudomonadota bacterium]